MAAACAHQTVQDSQFQGRLAIELPGYKEGDPLCYNGLKLAVPEEGPGPSTRTPGKPRPDGPQSKKRNYIAFAGMRHSASDPFPIDAAEGGEGLEDGEELEEYIKTDGRNMTPEVLKAKKMEAGIKVPKRAQPPQPPQWPQSPLSPQSPQPPQTTEPPKKKSKFSKFKSTAKRIMPWRSAKGKAAGIAKGKGPETASTDTVIK
ncbi:hypothetical protein PG994_003324 [Apiospora phragmitis]|uniref:Uncharacterized protein n=1 Tax=Apiospora phragmitis TaxID=2905665 RepID=A0ABR1VXU1_9PEZI